MSPAEQRLAEVRESISDILKYGQSVRKGDRTLERADLAALRQLELQCVEQVGLERNATRRSPKQIRLSHGGKGVL